MEDIVFLKKLYPEREGKRGSNSSRGSYFENILLLHPLGMFSI
jgi:hypothetical protein